MSHPKRNTHHRRRVPQGPGPALAHRPPRGSQGHVPGKRKDPELEARLDELVQLTLQQRAPLPTSPLVERLLTSSDREAIDLLRAIKRRVPRTSARKVGRPKGPTTLDPDGVRIAVLVTVIGLSPARALRAIGRNARSGSTDFAWVKGRVNAWRHFLEPFPPERRRAVRDALTRAVLSDLIGKPVVSIETPLK